MRNPARRTWVGARRDRTYTALGAGASAEARLTRTWLAEPTVATDPPSALRRHRRRVRRRTRLRQGVRMVPQAWIFVLSSVAPPPETPATQRDVHRARLLTVRSRSARLRAAMAMRAG